MSLITNLIPNPLLMFPNSTISTREATVRHVEPDGMLITPNSGAVNPLAKIRLCEPVSGDFHLNFWIYEVPEDSQWYENGICYVANATESSGFLLPHDNTAGTTFLGLDFHMNDMAIRPVEVSVESSAAILGNQSDDTSGLEGIQEARPKHERTVRRPHATAKLIF